jgi:hypothetical protein
MGFCTQKSKKNTQTLKDRVSKCWLKNRFAAAAAGSSMLTGAEAAA